MVFREILRILYPLQYCTLQSSATLFVRFYGFDDKHMHQISSFWTGQVGWKRLKHSSYSLPVCCSLKLSTSLLLWQERLSGWVLLLGFLILQVRRNSTIFSGYSQLSNFRHYKNCTWFRISWIRQHHKIYDY